MKKILSVGYVEFLVALLLGAPVKSRSGKIYRLPYPKRKARGLLDPKLFGFDFSKWQSVIDFKKVFDYGAEFIILRASYGIKADERFVEYITAALQYFAGLLSVYHYYDPVYSPQLQAEKLLSVIGPYRGKIKRVWIDLEFSWSGNFAASKYWQEFAILITQAGYEIGFYTRKTWWDPRVGSLASWFGVYPLWAAQYYIVLTLIPLGWLIASLWQDGTPAIGREVLGPGGSLEVDHDIADTGFFLSEYGNGNENGGGSMNGKAHESLGKTPTVRSTQTVASGNDITYLMAGENVEFSEIVYDSQGTKNRTWLHITSPVGGYVCYTEDGHADYFKIDSMPSDPPPTPPPTTAKIIRLEMDLAPGSVVTIFRDDGTSETVTA